MAVDFAHPVITDLYAGTGGGPDWPTYIQDNIAAVASWLDGADPAGKRVGFKRISGGEIQEWNGSAWVRRALNYFSSAGGAVTGPVTITGSPYPLELRSGSAGLRAVMTVGRTAAEAYFGIASAPDQITTGDVAGDLTIRNTSGRIFFTLGTSGYLSISATTGIISGAGLTVIGAGVFNAGLTGVRLGQNTSGNPFVHFTNAGGGADGKMWDFYASTTQLIGRVINDVFSNDQDWLRVTRSGATIQNIAMPNGLGLGIGGPPPNYGGDIKTVSVNATGQAVFDLHINSVRAATFTVPATAGAPVMIGSLAARPFQILTNSLARLTVGADGIVGINRTPTNTHLEVAGVISAGYNGGEFLRGVHSAPYITFYTADLSVRRGYIQHDGSAFVHANEANGKFIFIGGTANRLIVSNNGHVYAGDEVAGNRLVRAGEMGGSSAGITVNGVRLQWGKVATSVGGSGTVSFSAAYSSAIYACVAFVEGGNGAGFVFRMWNLTGSGFNWGWDTWNGVGGGASATVHYFVAGI